MRKMIVVLVAMISCFFAIDAAALTFRGEEVYSVEDACRASFAVVWSPRTNEYILVSGQLEKMRTEPGGDYLLIIAPSTNDGCRVRCYLTQQEGTLKPQSVSVGDQVVVRGFFIGGRDKSAVLTNCAIR